MMMPSEKASSFPMFSGEGACDNIAANVAHAMSKTEWASADKFHSACFRIDL